MKISRKKETNADLVNTVLRCLGILGIFLSGFYILDSPALYFFIFIVSSFLILAVEAVPKEDDIDDTKEQV